MTFLERAERGAFQLLELQQHINDWVLRQRPACGHIRHTCSGVSSEVRLLLREGESRCLDCGHTWQEYPITLSDDEYDTLVAYMAFRLDNK